MTVLYDKALDCKQMFQAAFAKQCPFPKIKSIHGATIFAQRFPAISARPVRREIVSVGGPPNSALPRTWGRPQQRLHEHRKQQERGNEHAHQPKAAKFQSSHVSST